MEIKNVHCEKQALELFRMMPDNKKSSLHNALSRNLEFTTSWGLELGELRAYQNGVYITLQGTRCSFSVYAELVNGKPVFKRQPPESKLSLKSEAACCSMLETSTNSKQYWRTRQCLRSPTPRS